MLETTLREARRADDERPPLELIAGALADIGVRPSSLRDARAVVTRGMAAWLRRVQSAGRSSSAVRAYRTAIADLIGWADREARTNDLLDEQTIVDYLDDYRRRVKPAEATYHRHFVLLRKFMRWLSQQEGVRDPFRDLEAPRKPCQVADWLTPEEFARLLAAAANPKRRIPGLAERDRIVLLALVATGLRRSELIALDWSDLDLDSPSPTLLVRRGKGGKPRRQPLAAALATELRQLRVSNGASGAAPVFTGLRGARLQPTALAGIIGRASKRAGIEKHVSAHTLRHTAATWLRQATGDARLVAEYLGHADLSTVSRYAHVAPEELTSAVRLIADAAGLDCAAEVPTARNGGSVGSRHEPGGAEPQRRVRASDPSLRHAAPVLARTTELRLFEL